MAHTRLFSRLRAPPDIVRSADWTARWQRREISNFDYLMLLNTAAGRTYNDLTQYPVFPWVLADYTSEALNLADPGVYRDLSKPVGALHPERLERFLERFREFDDPVVPKFMYGTHYSNPAAVINFLIRIRPFADYAKVLQGGAFDVADRLVHSLPEVWQGCLQSEADVKELVPELFYLPECLLNVSCQDLGTRQDGVRLGHVVLPPWARSAHEFVQLHRAALESEHVSQQLHLWVDLVFGCKQRGPEAERAHNVHYYLTYEGAVDVDAISVRARARLPACLRISRPLTLPRRPCALRSAAAAAEARRTRSCAAPLSRRSPTLGRRPRSSSAPRTPRATPWPCRPSRRSSGARWPCPLLARPARSLRVLPRTPLRAAHAPTR